MTSSIAICLRRSVAACFAITGLVLASCVSVTEAPAEADERQMSLAAADGQADALLFLPAGEGAHPALVLWPDLTGLRPAFADLGRSLADAGYVVLAPNAFYRSVDLDGSADQAEPRLDFGETMQRGAPWRAAASDAAIMADVGAYVRFLDGLAQVDADRGIGMVGVDIGGAHAFIAARALPQRVKAVAAIHPLSVATSRETSPHLFVDQSAAEYLVVIARPDDEREPGDKTDLRNAFAAAGLEATVKVVPAGHGFQVPDDPAHDADAAAATMRDMLELFDRALQ
jgi:carboxymethylenebutenolidase